MDGTLPRERSVYMEDPQLIPYRESLDERGTFQKILDPRNQAVYGLKDFSAVEMFTTITKKHGIRGMHIQIQPYASRKIVWVTKGEIFDVVINVSAGENQGRVHTFKLSEDIKKFLYVPSNYAHGFQALTDNATVNYLTDSEYKSEFDKGFHMASFNSIWPHEPSVLSPRDWTFPSFEEFCENI